MEKLIIFLGMTGVMFPEEMLYATENIALYRENELLNRLLAGGA